MSKLDKLIIHFCKKPPEVSFEDVVYILKAFGFEEKRSKGSHHSFRDTKKSSKINFGFLANTFYTESASKS